MDASLEWLEVNEAAAEAGLTRQAMCKAIRGANNGRLWDGHRLDVRTVFGRGGKSGRRYQVSLRSLSEALEARLSGADAIALPAPRRETWRLTAASPQDARIAMRFAAIEAALEHGPGTSCRAAAIRAEVAKGKYKERTLQRWIANYEKHGMPGLGHRRPKNAGIDRVMVHRDFDRAFHAGGYGEDLLAEFGRLMRQRLKDISATAAQLAGATEIRTRAESELLKLCRAHGVELPIAAIRVSHRLATRAEITQYRQVFEFKNDAAKFKKGLPRIRRDRNGLAPMQRVVADVKHLDVILQRPDGSEAWPKVVGFHDEGTGRVFLYPLLLKRGEGVRQEHVIEAFIAMVGDPAWGFPQGLYLDNGTEFACFEKIRPALDLVNNGKGREIIYALPYNASAKSVENSFKRCDSYLFSTLPGYAGGDRLWKKTQTEGRPPKPYPHSWAEFCQTLKGLLIGFNDRPLQRGGNKASANERFREKVNAGWRPVLADPQLIDAAFCDRTTYKLDRGAIYIKDRRFHHEQLDYLVHGTHIVTAIPWRRGADPLFMLPDGTWIAAEEDYVYAVDDAAGAKDAGRRKSRYLKGARKRAAEVQHYDPVAASLEAANHVVPVQIPGQPDWLEGNSDLLAIMDARKTAEAAQPARLTAREIEASREEAETAYLERKFNLG